MNKDIYTIYRACRLCGVGAGYKMPIIQSVIEIDNDEIELKQKIKECVQIEVNFHDRMPPLICELCVDKIQDFYEFRKMCQETNKKTRLRLGLPVQTLRSTLHSEPDCILGVTEPIISDSDEALSKQAKKPKPKSAKIKKESVIKIKDEPIVVEDQDTPSPELERRETRRKRPSSPKRVTRQNRADDTPPEQQDVSIVKLSSRIKPGPKSAVRERQKPPEKEITDDELEENVLLRRLKRSREILEPAVPTKKSKLSSEPAKQKPGPKFSKEIPKPTSQKPQSKSCPKSKTQESVPTKSHKSEPISTPGPKSKKTISESQELTTRSRKSEPAPVIKLKLDVSKSKAKSETLAGPKSRKAESATPTPKIKQTREAFSSAPTCKKREPSPKADRASPPPPKVQSFVCNICGIKAKAAQGLRSHMTTHAPTIINVKMACNACELWFPSTEAAAAHHDRHAAGLAYTCAKCYDDFHTAADYELHFVRNQCLPTYEVPDVKCDTCWKMFPTYKLLEDHKCLGEGGRPGGKCPNCKRTYVSLKGLTTHEMRCNIKKKEESELELERARGMLAMRVRLVRCDSLLTSRDGRYSVNRLSHKFGLDRNCFYPYLSMGGVKLEPATTFDPMVAIDDEVKEEYLNLVDTNEKDMVHWDSESDSDSNIFSPNKSVDRLSIIALKTLFSSKCLGKVPRKKRKVKLETVLDSKLVIHFHEDLRRDIDNIIDSLADESNATDNNDSDNTLYKDLGRCDENSELFDDLKNLTNNENAGDQRIIEKSENNPCSTDIDSDRICNNSIDSEDANLNRTETNNQNEVCNQSTVTVNDKPDILVDGDLKVTNDSHTRLNEDTKPELPQNCNDDSETTKSNTSTSDDVSLNNDTYKNNSKNGHLLSNNIVKKDESLSAVDKENSNANNMNGKQSESITNNTDVNNFAHSSDVKINETIEKLPASNIEKEVDTEEGSSSLESNKTEDETVQKDEPQSSHETDNKISENGATTNGKTNDEEETFHTVNNNENGEDIVDNENEDTAELQLVDSKDSLITENELFDNDNIQSVDKFNINYLDEEDKLLMAELDDQIGENQLDSQTVDVKIPPSAPIEEKKDVLDENSDAIGENSRATSENCDFIKKHSINESVNEQNTNLDADINNRNDLKSLDLDSISDEEFNFDI